MPVGDGDPPSAAAPPQPLLDDDADMADISCAVDALSCVESGDESVLDLIARTAFGVGAEMPLSEDEDESDESESSLSSYGDAPADGGPGDDYPLDRLKLAALSSAFAGRRRFPVLEQIADGQRGQFLLPLITSADDEPPRGPLFAKEREGILKALAEGADPHPDAPPAERAAGPTLEQITRDIESLRSLGLLKRDEPPLDDFVDYDEIVASIVDDPDVDFAVKRDDEDAEEDPSPNLDETDYDFIMRDCCDDYFLAQMGSCPSNGCHSQWKHILRSLVEYILGPNFQEAKTPEKGDSKPSEPQSEDEIRVSRMPHDPDIPQIIFDCDSVNLNKRFVFDERADGECPGGCANPRPCRRFVEFYPNPADSESPSPPEAEEAPPNDYDDPDLKYIDIQSAWYEMKVLTLWFYWVLERRFEDASQMSIGFQVPCNCCSCSPLNIISRLERLKHLDANSGESEPSDKKCNCKFKEVTQKRASSGGVHKFQYLLKCPRCLNQGEIDSNTMNNITDTKLAEYLHILGLNVDDRCCCRHSSIKKNSDLGILPVCVASKNPHDPAIHVDLLSGAELTEAEVKEKIDSSVNSFYNSSREHWMNSDWDTSEDKESCYISTSFAAESPVKCKRCRCSCRSPKFYNFFQVISRMTSIIDNFTRISRKYLVHRMDEIFAALCARYKARLIAFLDVRCEYTFLSELVGIVQVFKKADILLMYLLGPTRARMVSTFFFVLPAKQFLNIIYKWADTPALDLFLEMSVMVIHDMLPPEWKEVLLQYVDILPYIQDAQALWGLGENLSTPRSVIDRDDILVKMYQQYYYIGEKCLAKDDFADHGGVYKLDAAMNKETKQFYDRMSEEIKDKQFEIELFSKIESGGWRNFEKLVVFAMIKSYATKKSDRNDDCVSQHIERVLGKCSTVPASLTEKSVQHDAAGSCQFKQRVEQLFAREHLDFFQKRSYREVAQVIYFNLSKHCRNEWMSTCRIYYKTCDSAQNRALMEEEYAEEYFDVDCFFKNGLFDLCDSSNSAINIINTHSSYFDIVDNSTYSAFKPASILVSNDHLDMYNWDQIESSYLDQDDIIVKDLNEILLCSIIPDYCDEEAVNLNKRLYNSLGKVNCVYEILGIFTNENENLLKKIYLKLNRNLDSRKWFLITAQILCNSIESDIRECDETEELSMIADDYLKLDSYMKTIYAEPSYKSMEDEYFSPKNKMTLEKFQCQILEKIIHKIAHPYDNNNCGSKKTHRKSIQDIDLSSSMNKLKITSEEISSLEKQDCEGCESNIWRSILPFIFENLFVLDHFESLFSTSEKIEILREHFSIISQIDKSCIFDNLSFKNLDFDQLDSSNLWEPTIEEVEDELLKFEKRKQSKEEFEQDLHIICFKLVTRNMLEELMSCGDGEEHAKKPVPPKRPRVTTRLPRKINGHFVDDYWDSIEVQFVNWRSIALKMYLDVVKINKIGFKMDADKSNVLDDECLKKLQKIDMKISGMNDDPIKKLAVRKSFGNKISPGTGHRHIKANLQNEKVQKLAGESWLQAINELRNMKVESLGKKHTKCDSPTFKSASPIVKKRNDETREAELLAGMGLGKLLSKASTQKTAPKSDEASAKPKSVEKTVKAKDHMFSDCMNDSENYDFDDLFKKYTGSILKKINKIINDGSKEPQTNQVSEKSNGSVESNSKEETPPIESKEIKKVTTTEEKVANGGKKKIDPKTIYAVAKQYVENEKKTPSTASKEVSHKDKTGNTDDKCIGVCKHEAGKCSLHPDQVRSGHQVPNDHPCNCCYCTVFGHAPSTTTSVSRNFNETRERLRTILNKKKQNSKMANNQAGVNGNKDAKKAVSAPVDAKVLPETKNAAKVVDKKIKNVEPTVPPKPKAQLNMPKVDDTPKKRLPEIIEALKQKQQVEAVNSTNSNEGKKSISLLKKQEVKTEPSSRAVKYVINNIQHKLPQKATIKDVLLKDTKITVQNEQIQVGKLKKSVVNEVVKGINNSKQLTKGSQLPPPQVPPQPAPRETKVVAASSPVTTILSGRSRDSSFCTSSVCSGCSEYKIEDTRDINSLVKFIEESTQDTDKEKKQAKKARQKIKKLEDKLLKERDVLHENLISMAGETSRLHEEVVRLKKGLSSAYRRLPLADKQGGSGDSKTDIENHECVMLLRRAAQEASARATKAVSLAEHAQSQLRHVESTLNLLSSSVTKVCKQQKGDDWDEQSKTKSSNCNGQPPITSEVDKAVQNMVTIKRIMLPYSDEPGVTITPKLSNMPSCNIDSEQSLKKNQQPKKAPVSWESTIAQINALAQSSKKEKEKRNNEKKSSDKKSTNEAPKQNAQSDSKKSKSSDVTPVPANSKSASASIANAKEDGKKLKKSNTAPDISVEPIGSNKKTNKKEEPKTGTTGKKDKTSTPVPISNEVKKQPNAKDKKVKNKNGNDAESNFKTDSSINDILEFIGEVGKKNKKKKEKELEKDKQEKPKTDMTVVKAKKNVEKVEIVNNGNNAKSTKKKSETIQQPVQQQNSKGKKQKTQETSTQQLPNPPKNQPKLTKSNSSGNVNKQQYNLVNNLSSAMDRIRLNDDTTIELASSLKKESGDFQDSFLTGGKGAPISSSIVEQLKSGVQFADLRLPPGITLTRVDPSKQQHFATKPNIPLVTSNTPAAYRPTPPAPPPPAVIMVDTNKLHADRESKNQSSAFGQQIDPKKPGKSKKSKKRYKKTQNGIANPHQPDEPTKMVTLRNPMFHPTMAPSAVPTLQPAGKRGGRMPEQMPIATNGSCQATITPTSNGMYTIRNPLIYQQSMMGMNQLETASNPLLLMANQHLGSANPPTYTAEETNLKNDAILNVSNKMSDLGLEHKNNEEVSKQTESHFSPFKNLQHEDVPLVNRTISPMKQYTEPKQQQQFFYERPPMKPIGTPYSQSFKNEETRLPEKSIPQTNDSQADLPKLYTPFGPTDADKSFGSTAFQPYLDNHDNQNRWPNQPQYELSKKYYSSYMKGETRLEESCSSQKSDMCGQSLPNGTDGIHESPKSFLKQRNAYEVTRDAPNYSKYWNTSSQMINPGLDYQGYYNNQLRSGISSLYQPSGSSSSSCIFSGSSYDSVSNSSSNSPAADANSNTTHSYDNFLHHSEYPAYMPMHGRIQTMEQNGHNYGSDMVDNAWKSCCPPVSKFNSSEENQSNMRGLPNPNMNNYAKRMSNGLKEHEYFSDSSSIFAPDQTITNLNDLESSERDIESFKRFDFYFEPPKNKPKISLNVQDIAVQRPTPTKLVANRDK